MSADFGHEHWAFIWPSYGLALAVLAGLAWSAYSRLSHWAKRARKEEDARS